MSIIWTPNYTVAEEAFTRNENYDDMRGLMSCDVTLRCAYSIRHLVVADICGLRRPWPAGAAATVPLACQAAIRMAENVGSVSGQSIEPADALVTIHYTTKVTDVISEELEATAQSLTLDHKLFVREDGVTALTPEQAPGVVVRGLNLVRTLYDLFPPLSQDLILLPGSVNQDPYVSTLLELTFDAETLLFQPCNMSRKVDSGGLIKIDMTKRFAYQPQGWNMFYFADTDQWEHIFLADDLSTPFTPYPVADFVNVIP